MGSKKKKNLLPSQKNKENDVCKSRSKKSAMSMPEQENFSTGIHNILPSTSGTVQASKKRTKKLPNVSNSQLKPYVDDSTDDDDDDEEMMTPEHKTRLNDSSAELVENMIPDNVLIFLLAKKVLTSYEVDLVKSKGSRMSMNEMLISLVRCKSDKAFSVLVETLKKTEQKHLAKLLTSTEKRKRKPGEISVRVDIENTTSSDCKGKEKQMNLDDEMDEMYDVIRSWLCKIKPQDNSREAYKQFKKQFDGTYKRIKKWLKLCKLRKKLCSKGRVLTDITNGSIHLWFHCSTVNGLLDLWEMYTSGKLLHFLQESLITQDIKQKFHLKMVKLKVRIINEEFQQCYQELSGRSFEGNEGVTEEQKAIQPPVSAKVEKRIPRQNMPPKGRKALKEV
ncbi:uncharacterized protein LOC106877111 [Octopus bimaculoides]|uniref:CARD domain-containing protein n=1 Tax=Octopus bimaculoides TaxID=37653 RepID=A0A0L8GGB2_OCTBM|nr:uncharacterized protein LOC106877111 [Octopus bimaculoides]